MALLFAARILLGFCIGGIWAIAGGLAERLVPPTSVGLALSVIFGGVAAASVFGVPLGVFLGEALGWRMAFLAVAVLAALTLLLLLCVLPPLPVTQAISWRLFTAQCANRRLLLGLLLTFLLVAGHFMAYTFVRPLLQTVAGIEGRWVGPLLFAYGAAGIIGNFIAGQAAAKRLRRTPGAYRPRAGARRPAAAAAGPRAAERRRLPPAVGHRLRRRFRFADGMDAQGGPRRGRGRLFTVYRAV